MSILGKILAIFNVFAVAGVLALMAMNYAERQGWEYAVFRHDLMINGLPLNDQETDELQQPIVSKIGENTQRELFQQVYPNTPVATQEAEVQRVKGALDSQLQSAGDKKKKIAALARILMPMADTIEQRWRMLAYQSHLRDDKTFADLKARLLAAHKAATAPVQGEAKPYENRFHDALATTFRDPPGPLAEEFLTLMKPDPKADFDKTLEQSLDKQLARLQQQFDKMFSDASGNKRAIARLLFNMVEVMPPAQGDGQAQPNLADNPAYKRFFIVVGVRTAVQAVNEQAGILQDIVAETAVERERERGLFIVEDRKEVGLVRRKKFEVDHHALLLASKKKELETHADTLAKRKQDVKAYEKQLAAERQKTAAHLQQLRKLSDKLFAERVQLRDLTRANQQLEKDIRALEEGR